MADNLIKRIRTDKGDCKIDYNSLANRPSSMKNPYALTFSGAASSSYDGTVPVNVRIPPIPTWADQDTNPSYTKSESDNKYATKQESDEKYAPADQTYTKDETDARYAPISAAIRPTVTGNPAVCENSAAWRLQGLKIYGKSTQNGEPSPENPVPIVSAGDGGDIESNIASPNIYNNDVAIWSYNGGASNFKKLNNGFSFDTPVAGNSVGVYNNNGFYKKPKKVWFSADITVSSANFSSVKIGNGSLTVNSSEFAANIKKHIHGEATFDIRNLFVVYVNLSGTAITVKVENMMVSEIDVDGYFDYQLQPLTISTPNGLPGIPVESGGNFTDVDGQQWICDVVDFGTQAFIKNVCTVNPKNLNVTKFVPYGNNGFVRIALSTPEKAIKTGTTSKCKYFKTLYSYNDESEHFYWIENIIYIFSDRWNAKEDFEFWLNALDNSEVFAIAEIANSTFTLISSEELAAYRALTSYDGTTIISTSEPVAGIEATYVMDGNKYKDSVDKRLAALEAAQTGI